MRWWTSSEVRRACELREQGLSLRQVARALARPLASVARHLRGRPGPAPDEARERQGVYRAACNRAFCAGLGWPEVTVPAQAKILQALFEWGPLDRPCLALACGWRLRRGSQGGLSCHQLGRWLPALTRTFVVEPERRSKTARLELSYVERLGGRPVRYALAGWLRERKGGGE